MHRRPNMTLTTLDIVIFKNCIRPWGASTHCQLYMTFYRDLIHWQLLWVLWWCAVYCIGHRAYMHYKALINIYCNCLMDTKIPSLYVFCFKCYSAPQLLAVILIFKLPSELWSSLLSYRSVLHLIISNKDIIQFYFKAFKIIHFPLNYIKSHRSLNLKRSYTNPDTLSLKHLYITSSSAFKEQCPHPLNAKLNAIQYLSHNLSIIHECTHLLGEPRRDEGYLKGVAVRV